MIPVKGYAALEPKSHLTPWNFERREPGPHDVQIEISYCGICHTDLHQVNNDWFPGIFPMVPGHEIVGKITKIGAHVKKFREGDLAPLARTIKNYGYFSYQISEALFLSEKEAGTIEAIFKNIEQEYRTLIDAHTQSIILSQIAVLLNYSERFYTRQFITRKVANNDLLTRLEHTLNEYFAGDKLQDEGLPSVEYVAAQLNVSAHYLTDMLRVTTGQNTQQHIQNKVIEKAKEILSTTSLSVGEIAYQLGFKYPQSFNKFFKSKTNISPLAFRQSFN